MLIRKGALLSEALVSLLLETMTTWLIVTTMQYFNRIQFAEEARMKEARRQYYEEQKRWLNDEASP
ncbi:hypothetical protein [Weissella confusa]|uniref:hypothetical protein n=1 Tax=Weissella confusa TaxID=1583 RepID=UPI00223B3997|nr:hypothetical protein [Weissella confusa]MCT0023867.1 hypothetical protein [Weissella confusa]